MKLNFVLNVSLQLLNFILFPTVTLAWNQKFVSKFSNLSAPNNNDKGGSLGFGSACLMYQNDHCNRNYYLVCTFVGHDPKCLCDPGHLLNLEGNGCTVQAGENCNDRDATCDPTGYMECSRENGVCTCTEGHSPLPSGDCSAGKGDLCTITDEKCNAKNFLVCDPTIGQCICAEGHPDFGPDGCTANEGDYCDPLVDRCDTENFLECSQSGKCQCRQSNPSHPDGGCSINYHDDCDPFNDKCNPAYFLLCLSDPDNNDQSGPKCQCAPGHFDHPTKHCLANRGEPCNQGDDDKCDYSNYLQCDTTNTCACSNGHPNHPSGGCTAYYDQECNQENDNCDSAGLLMCSKNGACTCKTGASYYPFLKQCLLLEGQSCSSSGQCSPNAFCDFSKKNSNLTAFNTQSGVCRCVDLVEANENGQCYLQLGHPCLAFNDLCDHTGFQVCDPVSQICQCARANETLQSDSGGKCKLRANSICDPTPPAQGCTEFSQCLPDPMEVNEFRCLCDGQLIANNVGKCVLTHESICDPQSPVDPSCNLEGFEFCHQLTHRCTCIEENHMTFNETDQNCYYKLNSPCQNETIIGTPQCEQDSVCQEEPQVGQICVKLFGAPCNKSHDGCSRANHLICSQKEKCDCEPSYSVVTLQENNITKCLGNAKAPCDHNEDCNVIGGSLICTNGQCDCFGGTNQTYDVLDKRCYSDRNTPCNSTVLPNLEDIPLLCQPYLVCKVRYGFQPYPPPYDGKCSYGNQLKGFINFIGVTFLCSIIYVRIFSDNFL